MKKIQKFACLLAFAATGFSLVSCDKTSASTKQSSTTQQTTEKTTDKKTDDNKNTGTPDTSVSDQNVTSLKVKTNPTKMEYLIGETFDATGGVLTVTYKDKSTKDLSMTDSRVTITALNTAVAGTKSVKITFGGKSVSLKNIVVTNQKFTITFNSNGGSEVASSSVEEGKTLTKPTDPTKEGYTFDNWYTDEECTLVYDFSSAVSSAFTLYARWLTANKATHTVTFDYDYYGAIPSTRTLKVENDTAVSKISVDPTRKGYVFSGWQKDGVDYVFTSKVTADITLKAKWTRSTTEFVGTQTYKFEAEDIDFTGIIGNGLSGTTTGASAIVTMPGYNASQDKYVSYMYKQGNTLKFELISDVDVSNVTFKASMSQELENYTYNKDNYAISVNGTSLDYPKLSFQNVPPREGDTLKPQAFAEYTLGTISLKKGNNEITFTTANSDAVSGTTMTAHAPLLDYISITADNAVVQWDNVKGYPVKGNY